MRHLLSSTALVLSMALAGGTAMSQAQDAQSQQMDQQATQPTQSNGLDHAQAPGADQQQDQQAQQQQPAQQQGTQQQAQMQQAGQECEVRFQEFEQQVAQDPEQRAGFTSSMMRDLRAMRDTALRLEQYGQTEACNEITQAMREIMQDPQQHAEATGRQQVQQQGQQAQMQQEQQAQRQQEQQAQQAQPQQDPAVQQQPATADQQQLGWQDQWTQDREQAVALTELGGQLRVDELIGADVRGLDNENIGEVDDVVLGTEGQPGYVIIAYGGFLGIGEELSAVPFEAIRVSPNNDVAYMDATQADLEQAPTFERGDYTWMQDEEWRQRNAEFYQRG